MKDTDIKELINETIDKAHKYDALLEENERLKKELGKEEDKPWPQVVDDYWFSSSDRCYRERWMDHSVDKYRLTTGNCHRTEEQAEAYRDWLTSPRTQARRMVEMCEGFDSLEETAWICFNRRKRVVETTGGVQGVAYVGGLSFATNQYAQAAIEKLGEPLIKVALGVITGEEAERIVMEAMSRG